MSDRLQRPTWSEVARVFTLGEKITLELMTERQLADDLAAALRSTHDRFITDPALRAEVEALLARYREARR